MNKINQAQKNRQASLGFLMQVIAGRIDTRMKVRLSEFDIGIKEFINLMMLIESDGQTQVQLGKLSDFPEYAMSRTVDQMVKSGLVERRPDPNSRRSIRVFMTDKGRDLSTKLPAIIKANNDEFLAPLDADEQAMLIKLLHKVALIPDGGAEDL